MLMVIWCMKLPLVMPTIILVDKGGIIKWRHQGYIPGEELEIQKQIENLLVAN